MMQVKAVVKMLQPGFNVASIAAKRRRAILGSSAGHCSGARWT